MTMASENHCLHEDQLQELSAKTAELEAKNGFKEQRINELIADNKRIESKIDKLTDTVNKVMLNSIKDDNNLNQRVITLETQIETQNDVLKQYQEEARKHREEERAKTNQRLTYITVGIAILTFALSYLFK